MTEATAPAATTADAQEAQAAGEKLTSRTVYLIMSRGRLGIQKKVKARHYEEGQEVHGVVTDADPAAITAGKRLLQCEEYDVIRELDSAVRRFIDDRALPSQFRRGIYLLPVELVEEVEEFLTAKRTERAAMVEAFLSVYEERITEAEEKLGSLFSATDYKSTEDARGAFRFSWSYGAFDVPGVLQRVSRSIFDRARQKLNDELQDVAGGVQAALRTGFAQLVQRMRGALELDDGGGRKKRFHESTLTTIGTFLDLFERRNITDDADLSALVGQARELLSGVDVDMVRSDDELRAALAAEFAGLQESMASLVEDTPRRALGGEDDDE